MTPSLTGFVTTRLWVRMILLTHSLVVHAFLPVLHYSSMATSTTTRLYIDHRIAQMIDHELYRQEHRTEFENEWMEQNRHAILHSLKSSAGSEDSALSSLDGDSSSSDSRQYRKDVYMASHDPQRYCADRCVATGNCDVYEDLYKLSPIQVRAFCEECVLSVDEEPCDVPEAFFAEEDNEIPLDDDEGEIKLFFETNDPTDSDNGDKNYSTQRTLSP